MPIYSFEGRTPRIAPTAYVDPSAVVIGKVFIGDNCYIGPDVVIHNSVIGNNVNLQQGVQVMLSIVSDNCFLPFRAATYLTTLMERCVVAQNTCLQMCVIGRGTFIGAGTTFTDFSVVPQPIRTLHNGRFETTGSSVVGGCVGHNCRLGSGLVVYPGRIIESDTVLVRSGNQAVISRNVSYEQGDHHSFKDPSLHRPLYRPSQERE